MSAVDGTAAIAVVAEDARLGRLLHRPKRAARARFVADACDKVADATPVTGPEGATWSARGVTVTITRSAVGGNDGRLLVDLSVAAPDGTPMRGALIRILDGVDADIGAKVRPDTLRVAAALLRAAAGAVDGTGPFLSQSEWDEASRAICQEAIARAPDGPGTGGEASTAESATSLAVASLLPPDGLLHDHKPLGPLNRHTLHWHSPGSIHPVEPPSCPAAAEVSIDRQGRIRLSFLWRPDWSEGDEDPVATLRAVAALREAEAASLHTRPEDRA